MKITNSESVNAIIEVIEALVYPTSKKTVTDVIPWQQEFTCFLSFLLQSGRTDFSFIS